MARHDPRKPEHKGLSDTQLFKEAFKDYEDFCADILMLHNRRVAILDAEDIILLNEGSKITDKPPRALQEADVKTFVKALDMLIIKVPALSRDNEFASRLKIEGEGELEKYFFDLGEKLCAYRYRLAGMPAASTLDKIAYAWEDYVPVKDFFKKCELQNPPENLSILDDLQVKRGRFM